MLPLRHDGQISKNLSSPLTIFRFSEISKPYHNTAHFTAPHWPWEGPDDEAESKRIRSLFDRDGGSQKTYAAMMQSLDDNIGRVLQALDASGLASNAIVIFTSDNGGERFSNVWPFRHEAGAARRRHSRSRYRALARTDRAWSGIGPGDDHDGLDADL